MSWHQTRSPQCEPREDDVEVRITGCSREPGDLGARRILPAPARASVGPFVFLDELGPITFPPGEGLDVRPHPHIGLAALTWLLEGELVHSDSLGSRQVLQPGAVNLLTAGRGVVHSERTEPPLREQGHRLHAIQAWLALPPELADSEPAFLHCEARKLPVYEEEGIRCTIIAGAAFGFASPVPMPSPTLLLDLALTADARMGLPKAEERALYVTRGRIRTGSCVLEAGEMAVLRPERMPLIRALEDSRVLLIGGDAVGPRELWWNFVATDAARLETARRDWVAGHFAGIEGENDPAPLPPA